MRSGTGKAGTGTRAGSLQDGKSATGGAGGGGDEGADGEDEEGDDDMAMVTTAVEGGGEVERAAEKKKMAYVMELSCGLGSWLTAGDVQRSSRRFRPRPTRPLRHVPPCQAEERDSPQGKIPLSLSLSNLSS